MGIKQIRYAAGALVMVLAVGVAAMPSDTASAVAAPIEVRETSWSHALSQLPEMTRVARQRHVVALTEVRVELRVAVRAADDLFESSKGKATEESRRKLAVERNRAYSVVMLTDDPAEPPVAQETLTAMIETVKAEVVAWEEAEARRIAEEARLAEEARQAAAAAASRSGGKKGSASSAQASGQTAQQYLEGIAAAYGGSISWSDAPCGRGAGSVSGCYQGGSTVIVSSSAYSSWNTAKGRGRNVVLHEVSHMLIQWKCGTVLLGGTRFENVTDAYAVLLGASSGTGYGYNDNDVALASAAIGGTCLEG